MRSPYSLLPNNAFWSRGVAKGFSAVDLAADSQPYLKRSDKVMSAGSCFAANIIPYIAEAGFEYLYTEKRSSIFRAPPENLSYDKFSAGYGNIYTARQLMQLLFQCLDLWHPAEDVWEDNGTFIDPFRPGLRYRARSLTEFRLLKAQHIGHTRRAFEQATVFVFTLGLTECWVSKQDGAVFPACPGTVAGVFDPDRHEFKNLSVAEIVEDMNTFIVHLRQLNPGLRIILTVSPVPLVATASGEHVLAATVYSKSVLRAAAEEVRRSNAGVQYFPAYEIVTGPQAPFDAFEDDRRNVSKSVVAEVMGALLGNSESSATSTSRAGSEEPQSRMQGLARSMMEYECEEAMQDKSA